MKFVEHPISLNELKDMSKKMYGNLVKAVVDVDMEIMVVDVEMHVDAEQELLEKGSYQKNLWGINIYPDKPRDTYIEFDSVINIRPSQGNTSRGVQDTNLQKKIESIVQRLVI